MLQQSQTKFNSVQKIYFVKTLLLKIINIYIYYTSGDATLKLRILIHNMTDYSFIKKKKN